MRHIWRDGKHFAGTHHNFFSIDIKLQRTFQNVTELFVDVTVQRDNASFFQQHSRQHYLMTNNQLPTQKRIHGLDFNIVPREIFQGGGRIEIGHCVLQRFWFRSSSFCFCRFSQTTFLFRCAHNPLSAPPSTNMVCPVMYDARSDASQTIVSATSLGSAVRFNAESLAHAAKISSSVLFCEADLARASSFNRSVAV